MNNRHGKVFIYDWPTGSGKTLGVLTKIIGRRQSIATIRAKLNKTVIFTPALGMRQAWVRDLGIFLLKDQVEIESDYGNFKPGDAGIREWRTYSGAKREKILQEINIYPRFRTFRELKKRLRQPSNSGDCHYLVLDEWHRLGVQFKKELQKGTQGKYRNHWWNLLGNNHVKQRNIFLCSATPLNPVNESKLEEKAEVTEEKEKTLLHEELQKAYNFIFVLLGHTHRPVINLWKDLDSNRIILVDPPEQHEINWQLPKLPTANFNLQNKFVKSALKKVRKFEVTVIEHAIKNSLPYTNEFRYCQCVLKTRAKGKKHYIGGTQNISFGLRYQKVFDSQIIPFSLRGAKIRQPESWILNCNGRLLRLLILLEHFDIAKLKKRRTLFYPISVGLNKKEVKKVVIFCTHQATAKGLYYSLKKLLPKAERLSIATSFLNAGKRKRRKQLNDLIKRFNNDDELRILIATDAFSESYDLHEKCSTVIHYELPWSPHRLFQRVGRVTRIVADKKSGNLFCNKADVGHVVIPGSVEEEQLQRLRRRIELLSIHELLPGIHLSDKRDSESAFKRYVGLGPGWGAQTNLSK